MESVTSFTSLLEAAKRCLIHTEWERPSHPSHAAAYTAHRASSSSSSLSFSPLHSPSRAESTAAAVFCQLMDMQHLRGVVQAAVARQKANARQQADGERRAPTSLSMASSPARMAAHPDKENGRKQQQRHSHNNSSNKDRNGAEQGKINALRVVVNDVHDDEQGVVSCAVQRYLAVLQSCDVCVQSLCFLTALLQPGGGLAEQLEIILSSVDVIDVFFSLVLCVAVALCWQQKQQQQQQQEQQTAHSALVSSSRDTSLHSRGGSTGGSAKAVASPPSIPAASPYAAIKDYYYTKDRHRQHDHHSALSSSKDDRNGRASSSSARSCQAVLKAVLPLLERRLPFTQLWRVPSLLAAVDVLARGLWVAQERVHVYTPPRPYASDASHSASVGAVRCPMCYAAALDSGLALEALTQLQHYYVIYRSGSDGGHTAGSESDGGEEEEDERRLVAVRDSQGGKDDDHDDDDTKRHHDVEAARLRSAPQSARALGWVAACRIALWNHRASALRCLTRCDVPPWVPAGVTADTSRFLAAHDSPTAALQLLWVRWWEAEVRLAANPLPHVAAAWPRGTARLIERTEEMQLCSCQLFLRHFIDDWVSDVDDDGTANGEGGGGERRGSGRVGWQRHQRLHRLLCIPLDVDCETSASISSSPTAATAAAAAVAASSVRGTLFHWLCAHKGSSSLLLRLLVLAAEGDLSRLRPTVPQNASLHSPAADTAAAATAANAHRTRRLEFTQERGTSFTSHAAPHVVQLGRDETQREKAGVSRKAHPSSHSPSSSSTDAMRRHCSAALLGTFRLADSCGHTALDVACQHGDAYAVRLLLERGLSPNSLDEGLWQRYESTLSLPLLRLLYDPSLLDGATTTTNLGSGNKNSSSSDAKVSLADRLRTTHCRAAAGRMLAQLAYRLWTEKVASSVRCAVLATPSPTVHSQAADATPAAEEEATQPVSFTEWSASYAACRAAHDRVLRPALAALDYDPHEPMARLTVLAVLTRQLQEWLTTVPPDMRSPTAGPSSPPHHGSVSASGAAHAPRSGAAAAGKNGEEEAEAAMSLREVRQQHTAALRLYTQLTCPLGRHLLHSAVAARTAVCAAVDARAAATAAVVLAAARARPLSTPVPSASANGDVTQEEHQIKATMTDVNDSERIRSAERSAGAAVAECASAVDDQVPLPLSEAAKAQRELQHLYTSVLRDVQQLDASLAAEQRRILATAPHPDAQNTDKTAQTATVLRGVRRPLSRPHHHHHCRNHDDDNTEGVRETATPTYVLVTIPSFAALHHARLQGSVAAARAPHGFSSPSDSSARDTARWEVIEPTLWCAAPHTPRQVWLRLPQEIDLDALLSAQDGGGYGVVAQDMPLVAPVQRGDLVTFRLTSSSASASSASSSACASPPQFVVQAIFSEWRTAPFMLYRQPQQQQQQQLKEASLPVLLPRTVVLPFLRCAQSTAQECQRQSRGGREAARSAAYGGQREHNVEDGKEVGKLSHQETNMTLHACCLAAVYTDEAVAEDSATTAADTQHPLDWLQVRSAKVGTGADVVSVLRTNSAFATRWARIVYAGLQPCWRASTAVDTVSKKLRQRASAQQHTKASHIGDGGGDGGGDHEGAQETVVLSDPFSTYEEPSSEEVEGEGYLVGTSKGNGSVLYTTLTVRRADRIHPSVPMADPVVSLWPQRIDSGEGAAVGDAVVDVTL